MPKLLILNGYAGTGKSTVSQKLGEDHNYALITQDYFLFAINTLDIDVAPPTAQDYALAIKNMMTVAENYMGVSRDIIIEGALVSIFDEDKLDIRDFITLGYKNNYDVQVVTLVANKEVRLRREKERNYVVPNNIDTMLRKAVDEMNEKIEGEIIIDTSNNNIEEVVTKIRKLVND